MAIKDKLNKVVNALRKTETIDTSKIERAVRQQNAAMKAAKTAKTESEK